MENIVFGKIWLILRILGNFLLDTVVPQDPDIRAIERMSAEEFMFQTRSADQPIPTIGNETISLFSYKQKLVRKALVEIKDYPNRNIAYMFGKILHSELTVRLPVRAFPYLILPIPITRKKRCDRGWNQCELILRGLKRIDRGKSFDVRTDVLKKIRETEDQVGKSRSERFENVKNSFSVEYADAVRDRHVIIFDDILTTGATLTDASRALTEAGAAKIIRISIAR
jgi:ComF family protein